MSIQRDIWLKNAGLLTEEEKLEELTMKPQPRIMGPKPRPQPHIMGPKPKSDPHTAKMYDDGKPKNSVKEETLAEGLGNLSPEIQKKLTKKLKQFHGPDSKIKFKNKGKYVHVKSRKQSEYSDDEYDHHHHVYQINHTPEGTIKLKLQSHSQIEESFISEKNTEDDEHFDKGYEHGRSAANDAGFKEKAKSIKKDMLADNPHKKGTPAHQAWHQGASEGHQDALDLDM